MADGVVRGDAGELVALLAAEIKQAIDDASIDERAVSEGLKAGRYLLLVDSLDEVPSVEGRERVVACLAAAVAMRWPCRIVLTTRPTAHTGVSVADRGLRLVRIAALDEDAIARMVARWSVAMGENDAYRAHLLEAISTVAGRYPAEGGDSLTGNPLLLTCMMLVYDQQRLLPNSPAELFERMVRSLCDAKPSPDFPSEAKREALERAFTSIQEAGGTSRPVREVAEALLRARPDLQTVDGAVELLDRLAVETGILRFETVARPRGGTEQIARPWHRSFQQFLVARRIAFGAASVDDATDRLFVAADGRPALIEIPRGRACSASSSVCTRSEAATRQRRTWRGCSCARWIPAGAKHRGRVLGIAAQGLAEYPDVLAGDPLREAVRDAVAASFAADGARWPLADRLLALEALGRLGDPRLDGDPWVRIEGGEFTMGDGEASDSVPQHPERVASFWMFSRPVTVPRLRRVHRGGWIRPGVVVGGGSSRGPNVTEPEDWREQRFHPNCPVVGVSWYEAMAFCAWASEAWGGKIDLPAEVEWEFAACGPEGAIYPWGSVEPGKGEEAQANYAWGLTAAGHATPVGAFPGGNRGRLSIFRQCLGVVLRSLVGGRAGPRPSI